MSVVSTVGMIAAVGLALLIGYCGVSLGLLFFLTPRDDPPNGYLIDAIFIVTAPFILAVVFLSGLRRS